MVEMEYEEERVNGETGLIETAVWRAPFNDEDAAIAQAGQDIAEGRNPVRITETPTTTRAVRGATAGSRILVDTAELRQRALEHGPSF